MPAVQFAIGDYVRKLGHNAPAILNNMFVEKSPTNQVDGLVHLQRPGLVEFVTVGTGPIRCVFKQKGTFNADYLVVSGMMLYRVTEVGVVTAIGFVIGTSRVQIDATQNRAILATGSTCYSTDGTSITTVNMPDGVPVQSVAVINGYFVLTQALSQRFYWLAPGDIDPDPLNFASAENSPDNIARVEHVGDELWFFGEGRSTEVWTPTGQLDLPFQRQEGRLYDQGCANRDTVSKLDNTLFWVGTDGIVYRADTVPIRVSDNSIEELISQADKEDLRAWVFWFQGHTFYCLTIGAFGTKVFDVQTSQWLQFSSYQRVSWRAHMGAQTDPGIIVAGDDELGVLWRLDASASNDNGSPLVRELMGGVTVIGGPIICASFSILCAAGWSNVRTGISSDPIVEMRFSDDQGNTWSSWFQMELGKRGEFAKDQALTRLGMMTSPGRLFHLRMTDDAIFRFSYARYNDWSAN